MATNKLDYLKTRLIQLINDDQTNSGTEEISPLKDSTPKVLNSIRKRRRVTGPRIDSSIGIPTSLLNTEVEEDHEDKTNLGKDYDVNDDHTIEISVNESSYIG